MFLVPSRLDKILNLLGFILRSTNIRNSFELSRPLHRLAEKLLAGRAHSDAVFLIISSEWSYSPFIFDSDYIDEFLPGFVLIGFPAPESSNPLLFPLAGHELGHALWPEYEPSLHDKVTNTIDTLIDEKFRERVQRGFGLTMGKSREFTTQRIRIVAEVEKWARKQSEELFCDFVALAIFGLPYLKAFTYLLAPQPSPLRDPGYPELSTAQRK